MIQGFFDDSGKESDSNNKIICVAGYIAAPGMWNAFSELWRSMLLLHGLHWLHMKDFMNDESSEYSHLARSWDKKQAILQDFSSAIKMNHLAGFGVSVDAEVWKRMPRDVVRAEGDAQQFCFTRMLKMVVERVKRSAPDEKISISFDCDKNFTPARFQRYIRLRENLSDPAKYLAGFNICEPKVFTPLQAADLLAWETRKDLLRQISGHESRPEFKHMMLILPGFFPD